MYVQFIPNIVIFTHVNVSLAYFKNLIIALYYKEILVYDLWKKNSMMGLDTASFIKGHHIEHGNVAMTA